MSELDRLKSQSRAISEQISLLQEELDEIEMHIGGDAVQCRFVYVGYAAPPATLQWQPSEELAIATAFLAVSEGKEKV